MDQNDTRNERGATPENESAENNNMASLLEKEGILSVRHGSGIELKATTRPLRIGIFSETDLLDRRLSVYHTELPRALRNCLREQGALPRLYNGTGTLLGEETDTADWDLIHDLQISHLDGLAISGFPRDLLSGVLAQRPVPVVGDNHFFTFGVAVDWAGLLREGCSRRR